MESLLKIPFISENGSYKIICKEKNRDGEKVHPTTPTFYIYLSISTNNKDNIGKNAPGRKADQGDENTMLQAQH